MSEVKEKATGENSKKASAEIQEVLQKYNCRMHAHILVTEQGNFPEIFIIENDSTRDTE